ncbi:unnamed protein product [Prorocentrum cordatum]|uniref:Uncharacterized protein n=1 Tax=Prorocentrum cordatum TaxID=2364126 RepID=A0ABN9VIS1_9DINO|nr:unnamed protein product [Polarella glacialis]
MLFWPCWCRRASLRPPASALVSPHSLACAQGQAFAANAYQVFRVPISGGAAVPEPCLGLAGAREAAARRRGRRGRLRRGRLLAAGAAGGEQQRGAGAGLRQRAAAGDLLLGPPAATRLALASGGGGRALAATAAGAVVELGRAAGGGWRPLWDVASDEGGGRRPSEEERGPSCARWGPRTTGSSSSSEEAGPWSCGTRPPGSSLGSGPWESGSLPGARLAAGRCSRWRRAGPHDSCSRGSPARARLQRESRGKKERTTSEARGCLRGGGGRRPEYPDLLAS